MNASMSSARPFHRMSGRTTADLLPFADGSVDGEGADGGAEAPEAAAAPGSGYAKGEFGSRAPTLKASSDTPAACEHWRCKDRQFKCTMSYNHVKLQPSGRSHLLRGHNQLRGVSYNIPQRNYRGEVTHVQRRHRGRRTSANCRRKARCCIRRQHRDVPPALRQHATQHAAQ
jgi:hypothetical protein